MGSRKKVQMNLYAGQEQRHRCREWAHGQSGGGVEDGMNWDGSVDMRTLPRVWELPYSTQSSAQGSVMT